MTNRGEAPGLRGYVAETVAPWLRGLVAAIVCVVLAVVTVAPAVAQQPYILGPGDVLEISVFGYPDLTRTVAVRPDGKVSFPFVGAVQASGLTPERLAQILTRALAAYIVSPRVTVIVKEFRRITVSILGQVARPGTYALPPGSTILEAIAAAGDVTEVASLGDVQVMRQGLVAVSVDLEKALAGDPSANIVLQGGETIVIREDLVNIVNVAGEVAKPGRYRLKGEMRVLDILLLAGGLTEKASLTTARLVRKSGESVPLQLEGLLLRQNMSLNAALRPGDSLIIPEDTDSRFFVLGDVRTPGVFPLRGRITLLQAITMAGGPVLRGPGITASTVHVVRRNGTTVPVANLPNAKVEKLENGASLITLDMRTLMSGTSQSQVLMVEAGDVIVVPQTALGGLQTILSILLGISALLR